MDSRRTVTSILSILLCSVVVVAPNLAAAQQDPQPPPTDLEGGEDRRPRNLEKGLRAAAAQASDLTTLAVALVGATALLVLQAAHKRPHAKLLRLTYLLLPIGWVSLGASTFYGFRLRSVHLAYFFGRPEQPEYAFASAAGTDARCQRFYLIVALVVFFLWLLSYLIWWIFSERVTSSFPRE